MNIEPSIDHSTLSGSLTETTSFDIVNELEAEENEPLIKSRAKSSIYTPEFCSARTTREENACLLAVEDFCRRNVVHNFHLGSDDSDWC